jgi:hypothetical protein
MPAKVARQANSGRRPVRRPPLRKIVSAEITTAVRAKSAQTGWLVAWS